MKKIFAKLFGVPFNIKEHWPQYYTQCRYEFLDDKTFNVVLFDHDSKVGNIVDVLKKGKRTFRYKITRISYAPGGDWGMYSPKQFDLKYHSNTIL
jgi:hypothetical protein